MSIVKLIVTGRVPDYQPEEDDFFGSFVNKRMRKYKKKLKEIEDLEGKTEAELDESQREKIRGKAEQEAGLQACEDVLKIYVAAYCDTVEAKEEPRIHLVPGKKELKKLEKKAKQPAPAQEEVKEVAPAPAAAPKKVQKEADNSLINILNLVHTALYFADSSRVEEYKKAVAAAAAEGGVENHDLHVIVDLYSKIFTYTESSHFTPNSEKIRQAAQELDNYLSRSKNPALKNKTYSDLFEVVERVANSKHFQDKTVGPTPAVHKHEAKSQGAIGSEIKTKAPAEPVKEVAPVHHKEQVVEKPAPAAQQHAAPAHGHGHGQHASPHQHHSHEEAKPAQPAKVEQPRHEEPKQPARKQWHEEEEDEEDDAENYQTEEIERGGPSSGEEKKDEDGGWTLVGVKKPKDAPTSRGRGRGRGGRGRGGPRRPRTEGGEGGEGAPRERRGPPREGGFRGGRGGGRGGRGGRGGQADYVPKAEGQAPAPEQSAGQQ